MNIARLECLEYNLIVHSEQLKAFKHANVYLLDLRDQCFGRGGGGVGVSESPGKAGEGPSARGRGGAGGETSSVLGRQSLHHL